MKFLSAALFLLGISQASQSNEIFLEYGQERDTQEIFKYFYDTDDAFWAEFGAYHPTRLSNTMGLYAQGWTGVSVDASASRIAAFNLIRPSCINIFSAVGDPDTILTLYEMNNWSTVIESVK